MVTPPRAPWCLAAGLAVSACTAASDGGVAFALVGDNPYGADLVPKFEALIEHVNAQRDLAWVIHVGDLKGTEPCSDELLRGRFDLLQRFDPPLIFTPGDNDWYDCRESRMGSFDAHDRLAYLRRIFYSDSAAMRVLDAERQGDGEAYSEFVENMLWFRAGVVFATVHLVRTDRPPSDSARAVRRLNAALAWIARAFQVAEQRQARGVFIATQADPWFASGLPAVLERVLSCPQCLAPAPGLERLYPVLVDATRRFRRPVVLAVGDTHIFRVDKPLYDPGTGLMVENFTRIETFGHPDVHWVRVTVDPAAPGVFSFTPELVPDNLRGSADDTVGR